MTDADLEVSDAGLGAWGEPAFRSLVGEGLTHFFGHMPILIDAAMELRAGEAVAIVGPNGAGKTTLLRILATLMAPDEGSVVLDGEIDLIERRKQVRPHIGWLGHDVVLYPELTGRENLAFWARLHGAREGAVEAWLERCGMMRSADKLAGTYSRGMKQRLAVARSLVHEPTLVLWDEPSTGLDIDGRVFLRETLDALRAAGRLVVVITHQLQESELSFDRTWALRGGALYAHGADVGLEAAYRLAGRS